MQFFKENAVSIIGIIVLLLGIIIIFQYSDRKHSLHEKRVEKIVTVEGYSNDVTPGLFPDSENAQAMCEIHLENPAIIDSTCKTFSKNNCQTVDCCVWKNKKCVGGKNNSPFYLSS